MHVAMHRLKSIDYCQQEETNKGHSSLGITAAPGTGSPAKSMTQPLPVVHIEQSSAVLGASMPGEVTVAGSPFLPSCLQIGRMHEVRCVRISSYVKLQAV